MNGHHIEDTTNQTQLLTPEQTAKKLQLTTHTLNVWRATKRYPLPYVKIGRCVRYRLKDVEAFIDHNLAKNDPF